MKSKASKFMSLFLSLLLIFGSAVIPGFSVSAVETEVPEGYVGVYTKDDLYDVRNNMSGKYILMNDITFEDSDYEKGGGFYNSGKGWDPIGTSSTNFRGTFDGNGYKINNLRINNPTADYQGLFGYVSNATISNVTLVNADITGNNNVGGICGYMYSKSTVSHCMVTGKVIGKNYVGGICGKQYLNYSSYVNQSQIEYSCNSASIVGNCYVGGICGYEYSEYNRYSANQSGISHITACINTGNVSATSSDAGGIVGYIITSPNSLDSVISDISYCYNVGIVTAVSCCGGIVGTSSYSKIINTYSVGSVTSTSACGGIVGNCYNTTKTTFSYYLDEGVSSPTNTVGTAKSEDQLRRQGNFEQWDFNTVWTMDGKDYYQYPELQECNLHFQLGGEADILGDSTYGSTLSVDTSKITPSIAQYTCQWLADGEVVGTESTYMVKAEDIGKEIQVVLTGGEDFLGTLTSEPSTITKAVQPAVAEPAVFSAKSDTSVSVAVSDGYEYSIDGENWQQNGDFLNLRPNTDYTVSSRIAETDLYFASEPNTSLIVKTDKSSFIGTVSIAGEPKFGNTLSVDDSLIVPDSAEYTCEWKRGSLVVGTESSYVPTSEDIGKEISLTINGTGAFTGTATSSSVMILPFDIADVTASSVASQTYTHSAITPAVTLTNVDTALIKDIDYTADYINNISAGTATIQITGIGNYTGTKTVTFEITQKNIATLTVQPIAVQYYNGSAVTPELSIYHGENQLVSGTDFTVTFENNVNAGTATARISGKGNYSGNTFATFTISKTSISGATVKTAKSEYKYTGNALTPSVTVTLGEIVLEEDKDYTVSYEDNKLEGIAVVTVKGIGGYSGTAQTTFVISGHIFGEWITTKAATCTEGGNEYCICSGCGEEKTRETPALGHNFEKVVIDSAHKVSSATCTEKAVYKYGCTRCSAIGDVTFEYGEPNGHSFTNYETKVAPTCTENGSETAKCNNCDAADTRTVKALGHVAVIDEAVEPTCESTGLTQGSHCSRCDAVLVAQQTVPATGHVVIVDPAKGATCTETGLTEGSHCSVCEKILVKQETIAAKGHVESEWKTDVDSDCVNGGTKHKECTVCGKTLQTAVIPAKGHNYRETNASATCTAEGYTVHTCSVCGNSYVDSKAPALGHSFTKYVSDNNATCTKDGTKTAKCDRCGTKNTVADNGSKRGHNIVVDKAVESTCSKEGLTEGKHCSVCGAVIVAQKSVAKKPHTLKTTTTKATMTKDGKIVASCTVCKAVAKTTTIYKASSIKLSATSYTYNAEAKTPSVTVKDSKAKTLKNGTDYTVKYPSGRKNVGTYSVTVTLKGNYSGSKALSFNIIPKGTSIDSISALSAGFTAKWKKQTSQTTGYQVQYSTSSSFKSVKTITIKKNSTISQSVNNLKGSTKYYVRVRTYKTVGNKDYYSSWSSVKTVTTKPVTEVKIPSSATIYVGGSKTLSAKTYPTKVSVKWKSSNTSVAKVSSSGKVTAVKKGTATITAYFTYGGKTYKANCAVTVKNPSLSLSKTSVSIAQNSSVTIKATTAPTNVTVKWKSSNTSIAKVSSSGKITGVKKGTATITAYFTYAGKTYSRTCKVTVVEVSYGTVSGNITYFYNNYKGNVSDTNARIILVPMDGTASNVNLTNVIYSSESNLEKYHIYIGKVDGTGHYTINHVVSGKYKVLIISKNTTCEEPFDVFDDANSCIPDSYYDSIASEFYQYGYLNKSTAMDIAREVLFNKYHFDEISVYKNETTVLSYDFGITYI